MANQNINDQNDNENYLDKTINTLINFFEDSLQSDKEFLDILQKLQTETLNNNHQTINNNIDSNKNDVFQKTYLSLSHPSLFQVFLGIVFVAWLLFFIHRIQQDSDLFTHL